MKAILKGVISQKYGLNQEKIDYQGIQQQLQEQEIELSQQELQQYVQRADILIQSLIQKSEDNAEERLQKIIQEQGFDEERDIRDIIDVWLKNQEKIYSALMKKNTTSKILDKLEYSINNVSYSKKSKGLQEITSVVSLKHIIPSIAGIPEQKLDQGETMTKSDASTALFGSNLQQALKEGKQQISLKRPIQEGKVCDTGDEDEIMKELWKYSLDSALQVNEIANQNLLIIDQPHNDKDYKHRLANILFEDLKVSSVLFMNSATLSLFSTGQTTGLVVEAGHAITSVVPIFEGFPLPHAITRSTIAGEQITNHLSQILKKQGYELPNDIINDIKEKKCMIAKNYQLEVNNSNTFDTEEKMYELPDGSLLEIDQEARYSSAEILFDPTIIGDETSMSLQEMMLDSLNRCDLVLQSELYNNIVLCGGTSLLRGFKDRLHHELRQNLPKHINENNINFVENLHRRYSAWIGGSMLGSLSTFQSLAITRAEYEENPENKIALIHKRTF
ncbi:hypothetical protein PPERSA_07658 [Pseudocohnilembus persalinus]|uniref:Actin n=1 Tax=Pseudocohnilembus persalinus TaxID=266149 RepID=A0A0V0QIE9_PSEPJ|nr:hypothetical protein PPERSA_07658 [Pseudocohnilembus persalinus]|eukprot:KRX02013.1 hypothetical protein PPERSA_07658 [Pseudocohnilembus persalinus]